MHVWDYKNILTNFRLRKRLLAIADAFIIVVAGFFVNLPLPLFADRIGRPELFSYALLTVFSCFACLLFFGAYNKLWRYFSKRDYLSCVKGVVFGFIISGVIHYLMMGDTLWEFSLATCIVSIIGICLFRYLFRGTFISLVETGHREAFLKRTMIIGAGNATAVMLKEIERSRAGHGGGGQPVLVDAGDLEAVQPGFAEKGDPAFRDVAAAQKGTDARRRISPMSVFVHDAANYAPLPAAAQC